jgi:hypothetical protein
MQGAETKEMKEFTWGDGSGTGTGTGGTFQVIQDGQGNMSLEVWMGMWEPQVFHFSSN